MSELFPVFRRIAIPFLAAYWMVLVVATHIPMRHFPQTFDMHDKAMHFLAYGVLTAMAYVVWQWFPTRRPIVAGTLLLLAVAIHAAIDEMTQGLVGRQPDVWDWTADLLGAAAAILIVQPVLRRFRPMPAVSTVIP